MIKKLLFIGSVAMIGSMNAQVNAVAEPAGFVSKMAAVDGSNQVQAKIASATVVDTLWYFYNKHFFRNPASTGFFTIKAANTTTNVGAVNAGGSIFQNPGPVVVTGLEAVVSRQASSPSASVDVGLYIYNVSNGLPVGAPLGSLTAVATGTSGSFIGGNFVQPVIVPGDFAVMMKNISADNQDTIRLFINNALTAASTSTNNAAKYGEGLGVVQYSLGTAFLATTNAFGAGTDYEFLVAPRLGYSVTASASAPTGSCINTAYTFTNTSHPRIGHRQWNKNQFAVQWLPFANTASVSLMPDPVYVWNFGDTSPSTTTNGTVTTVSKTFANAGTFTGTLTANIQKMNSGAKTNDMANWTNTYANCSVGINENNLNANLNVYPNPAVNGKVNITGLDGSNVITVYNVLGQAVSTINTDKEVVTIDLSNQNAGNYFIRITNGNNQAKTVKVINH